jgi:dTMP kinase
MPKHNPFIVIEALDAGGSQTQTDWLVKRLTEAGQRPLALHFPQEDRATGRLIYDKFLLNQNKQPFSRREQALLYIQDFFSRAEDIKAVMERQSDYSIVISDRFYTSTLAYQTMGLSGAERTRMLKWLTWLCFEGAPQLPQPDIVVFLDTPVEVSLKRLSQKKKDFFETKDKLTAIRASYLNIARKFGWKVVLSVDSSGQERTREDMHEEIWQIVSPRVR